MGQAIWPGARAALMALPVLMLLMLPALMCAWAAEAAAAEAGGSGGSCTGREVRTVPGESMLVGVSGETGDGVKAPLLAAEPVVMMDTRLLSRRATLGGMASGCK
jgi:hypothetical protein